LFVVSSTFAGESKTLVIKGKVIGDNGKPQEGAEIKVRAVDHTAPEKTTITDAHGQYLVSGLSVGSYIITAYLNGFARSRAAIQAHDKGWAKVDFDLALDKATGDQVDRMQQDLRSTRLLKLDPH